MSLLVSTFNTYEKREERYPLGIATNAHVALSTTHRLSYGYGGDIVRLKDVTDSSTLDVNINSWFKDDSEALGFLDGHGGEASIIYDQSGNGRNAVQQTLGKAPLISDGSKIHSPSYPSRDNRWMEIQNTLQSQMNIEDGITMLVVVKPTGGNPSVPVIVGTTANSGMSIQEGGVALTYLPTVERLRAVSESASYGGTNSSATPDIPITAGEKYIYSVSIKPSGTDCIVGVNGDFTQENFGTTPLNLGQSDTLFRLMRTAEGTRYCNGELETVIIWGYTLEEWQLRKIHDYLM